MKPIPDKQNIMHRISKTSLALALATSLGYPMSALSDASGLRNLAPLKPDMPYIFVVHNGRSIKIERDIDRSYRARMDIRGTLIQNADSCPPFCLLPMSMDAEVETVGEIEIIDFMMEKLRNNTGTLIDVRSRTPYENSTIPGSINYFVQTMQKGPGDSDFDNMLIALGAQRRGEVSVLDKLLENTGIKDSSMLTDDWDFSEAKELVVWANSAIDRSSVVAIEELLAAGYPAEKLKWYRGGLASWQYWGFNTYTTTR